MMVDDLLGLLDVHNVVRAVDVTMTLLQMLPGARLVVLTAVLRLDDLSRSFHNVNFTNVLHQSLNVRQWRLIAFRTNAISPQAVVNDRLVLSRQLSEVSLDASNTFRHCMLQSISRILELIVALVPTALEDLHEKNQKINEARLVEWNPQTKK